MLSAFKSGFFLIAAQGRLKDERKKKFSIADDQPACHRDVGHLRQI